MEGQKNYNITTIKDIAVKIPDDKLDVFFTDLRTAIGQQKLLISRAEQLLGEGGRQHMIDALREEMVWIDDGKTESFTNISVGGQQVAKVTVEYTPPSD